MAGLFDLTRLSERLADYARMRGWKPEARYLLEEALLRGEFIRGDAPRITGLKERAARSILSDLLIDGILASDMPKGPVSLRFHVQAADILFPWLFPES